MSDRHHNRVYAWLDRRTGLDRLLREALDEPIPGGARFAYVFGSGLLFLFLSQAVTGIALALYYVPSSDHAHTSVAYISKQVAAGEFLRSLHAYGSSAIVVVLLLHILQTLLYGSYKGRRELLWLSGCVLFGLMMAMAFTGYLLPWDQKAYFATAVGTNVMSEFPLIGPGLQQLVRGGPGLGTLTLSRFFVAHVLIIPGLIFAAVGVHVYLFRKAGAAGPMTAAPENPNLPTTPFYPGQVVMDMAFALMLVAALGILAHFFPYPVGPEANPADSAFLPRPEWYYIPIFQWLKYWEGARLVLGVIVIPSLIAVLFVLLPFLDRGQERRPWRRPVPVGGVLIVGLGLLSLGLVSHHQDAADPAVAKQLQTQKRDVEAYMREPFRPEVIGQAAAPASAPDPQLQAGAQLFEAQTCSACHGAHGEGGVGPKLAGINMSATQLEALLHHPTTAMTAGGMPVITLPADQTEALVKYVLSLKN